MSKAPRSGLWLLIPVVASCGGDQLASASAQQIEGALTECGVQIKDYARDRDLDGRYLIMYHRAEPDHEMKMACVSSHLERAGTMATAIYPEPTNREGLF